MPSTAHVVVTFSHLLRPCACLGGEATPVPARGVEWEAPRLRVTDCVAGNGWLSERMNSHRKRANNDCMTGRVSD